VQEATRVLYIGGMTRSGSTLLDRTLDQLPGVCSVGESVYLFERGLRHNVLCACGEPFLKCPFWSKVGERAFGGWERLDVDEVLAMQRSVQRNRFIPAFVAIDRLPGFRRRQEAYSYYLGRLYRGIAEVAGARVVVDGTKIPSGAYMAWRTPGIELRLLHLLRDPRAVAYSWSKVVRRPEVVESDEYLPVYSPLRASGQYDYYHASYELLRMLGVVTMRLRYEDFVLDPPGTVAAIARFAGLSPTPDDLAFVSAESVEVGVGHSPAGNPMRFANGRLKVRLDDAWRREYEPGPRRTVGLLTSPLLARYGYLSKKQPHRHEVVAPAAE
jgi:hypothetical protein